VRQPGNDPLDLFTLCRILDRSGDGFKISKKALSFLGHDTDGPVFLLFATITADMSPQYHKKIPLPVGSGIMRLGRAHWAGAAAIRLKTSALLMVLS
jgi:hypothetical protein